MKQKITIFYGNFLIIAIFVANFLFFGQTTAMAVLTDLPHKTGEIIVKFKNSQNIITIKAPDDANYNDFLASYQENAEVEYAEPNYTVKAAFIPNDSHYGDQWYLSKIKASNAWDEIKQSSNVIVAVLDTGVQINHPDLRANIWVNKREIAANGLDDDKNGFIDDVNGWDFVNNVPDPMPKFQEGYTETSISHGTIIAGIIAASGNNAAGIAGIAWQAKIMPLKVLNDSATGTWAEVIRAIDYAVANGADIINLSFAGFGYSKAFDDAIERAYDSGAIIVAAAGNEEDQGYFLDQTPMYPVCYDGPNRENRIIGVAATDTLDQKTDFSSYGAKCIDLSAPGESIYSTTVYSPVHYAAGKPFNNYYDGWWDGTSYSVPMVSGAIALVEQVNPGLNRQQVIEILLDTADNINRLNPDYFNQLGRGRLNVKAAVAKAKSELADKTAKLIVAPSAKYSGSVRITDQNGQVDKEFYPYNNFKGGVSIASCDINGDSLAEIITGAGAGGGPLVKIFNTGGQMLSQFFAYQTKFHGGVNVACADLYGDGKKEIVVSPGQGMEPLLKIFDDSLNLKKSFLAYAKTFRGGVNLAVGDLNNNGVYKIITGPGPGGGPQVRIFDGNGAVKGQFFAYAKNFRGGVRVTAAKTVGGVRSDNYSIITAPGRGGGPHIRIFNNNGSLISQFFAFAPKFRGGVSLASGDIDNDGLDEIIAGAGPTGAPHVRVFKANKTIIGSFYAFEESYGGGVNVGSIKILK